ncbi:hypothetical protein BBJ29_006806 [Phytophthora kernoviae]|uniref:Uncharacterized protein n=1 Tax=Phytophthora kernoviae TaxID=325452 RepID=A0A3F2S0F3_9STRA|nr:hypothetical protein BBP00_00001421 [Phytophthora kernoviae]RLN71058.1 hypothetical protein BBJ29_006806 [Phytophthora kernoviae]
MSSSASGSASSPSEPQSTADTDVATENKMPIPTALAEVVANVNQIADGGEAVGHQAAAADSTHSAGDDNAEPYDAAIWEKILDESHIKLESYGDQPYYSEMAALSKPIIREDGILLVGTEIEDPPSKKAVKNRIFVTNVLRSNDSTQSPSHILVQEEVRDMHWMNARTAIVAVGKEIQLIQLGDPSVGGPCRLEGFDETVVLNDLRLQGDPSGSTVIGKFDANDVVSSVRWSPTESQISWTTDGGDFQVADIRTRSGQLQVPLSTYLHLDSMGGLFTHEYLSDFNIVLGFSTAELNASANGLQNINLRQQSHQTAPTSYKTSGDFSFETGTHLAVSDNLGVVSVYTDDAAFATSVAFNGPGGDTWPM